MKSILHKAATRGHFNHGWLDTWHTFSFARYHDPERMGFGTLRVLNDDTIAASEGFGMHPHDNMEIITFVLNGALEHKDSMGHVSVINKNDVQVMSAGTGLHHAEYNHSDTTQTEILQVWIFPREVGLETRYDQLSLDHAKLKNRIHTVVNPDSEQGLYIQQDGWISVADFDAGNSTTYRLKREENGLYVFIVEGIADVTGQRLDRRDGIGIWETGEVEIKAISPCRLILFDIPMQ